MTIDTHKTKNDVTFRFNFDSEDGDFKLLIDTLDYLIEHSTDDKKLRDTLAEVEEALKSNSLSKDGIKFKGESSLTADQFAGFAWAMSQIAMRFGAFRRMEEKINDRIDELIADKELSDAERNFIVSGYKDLIKAYEGVSKELKDSYEKSEA